MDYKIGIHVLSLLLATCLGRILYLGYRSRSKVRELQRAGIPMPKWSWWTGHMLAVKPFADRNPPDAHINALASEMAEEFGKTGMYLLDFWPLAPAPFLVVSDPKLAAQAISKFNLPRPKEFEETFRAITGGPNLFTMMEKEWKPWRTIMTPGFSSGNVMTHVPRLVDSAEIFVDKIREQALKDEMFCLEEFTMRFTLEVIIKVTLGTDMDYQRGHNPLASALRNQVKWQTFGNDLNLWRRWNPLRPIVQWYNSRIMTQYVRGELQKRFDEAKAAKRAATDAGVGSAVKSPSKSVIALALDAYTSEKRAEKLWGRTTIDEHFATMASYQIRLFLFVGHDSTSSTLVYTLHLLSQHPAVLARLRAEHASVFGPDPSAAAAQLRAQPTLLNELPYSLAVIQETLRLFPVASCMREGRAGAVLSSDTAAGGVSVDTGGLFVWIMHMATQTNPRVWPRPREFLPERWLAPAGDVLCPPPDAFRAFEHGPRACIGQKLVFAEIRTALVLVARTFDIRPAYDEMDRLKKAQKGWLGSMASKKEGVKHFRGERAYQIGRGGTYPSEGYPCRVTLLESKV
ncbi:cytochrome P450 [Apiospora arundinis]|uniref:Cytochrome P450 n=1 Tax=Apiospora arundinis TaxID=335852 RepID=A0ABR2HPJ9_9PEZI